MTDITVGGSKGCTGRDIFTGGPAPKVPFASWNATTGWDPVTGLGTPNFGKLLALTTPKNKLEHIGSTGDDGDDGDDGGDGSGKGKGGDN